MSEFVTAKCVGGPLDGREMTIRRGCTRFAQQLMDCDDPEDRANTAHYAMRVRVRPWSFEGESHCEYELVFQGIVIGATRAERDEANQQHATAYGALIILLIDKGIITKKEYDRAYIQAQHEVSQEFARKRDEGES